MLKNRNTKFGSKARGFTLIELLVVIAIIGILSSVVLASLNTARGKGADAAVKTNLANIRAQAEILYDKWGCYSNSTSCNLSNLCTAGIFLDPTVASMITSAQNAGGGTAACRTGSGGATWGASVPLKTGNHWCVDSEGKSTQVSAPLATGDTTC
ncbi:MAG: type II secretion system protein [bacterium]|nr:type II secretion system protein [bacterium]